MQIEIVHRPANAAAQIQLQPGETITAEGGSMVAMSADMQMETSTHQKGKGGGGIMKAVKRMVTGESLFMNHFTAGSGGGMLLLSTTLPGDMYEMELKGNSIAVQAGSFVAMETGVDMDMSFGGIKSLFARESLFWIKLSGEGKIILSSFGCIYPIQVNGEYVVDTGHIVAYDSTLDFTLGKINKSIFGAIAGGEAMVTRFKGQGTVWCQSHNPKGFGQSLGPMLRPA